MASLRKLCGNLIREDTRGAETAQEVGAPGLRLQDGLYIAGGKLVHVRFTAKLRKIGRRDGDAKQRLIFAEREGKRDAVRFPSAESAKDVRCRWIDQPA